MADNHSHRYGQSERSSWGKTVSRRTFLASSAAATSIGLAGCIGDDDAITIGFPVALSGAFAFIGESIINGFQLYVEEELGGEIDGNEVEYIQRDTEQDPSTGATITTEFIQSDNVDFVVGPVSASVAHAMYDVVEGADTVWINPNAASMDFVTDCLSNHFIICWHHYQLAEATAPWMLENLGDEVAFAYSNFVAGESYSSSFERGITEAGGEVVGRVEPPLGTEDFSPYLGELDDMDADFVWSFIAGADAINYIQGFHEFGLDEKKDQAGTGHLLSTDVLPAQGEAAMGKYSALPYTPERDIPKNNHFRSEYEATYEDHQANIYSANGYDAAQIAETAVIESGGTDVDGLVDVIRGVEVESPRGPLTIDAEGHYPIQDVHIREVKMGDEGPYNEVIDVIEQVEHPGPVCTE